MSDRTHMDLKLGVPYIHPSYAEVIYVIKRLVKGQAPAVAGGTLELPKQLATVCGAQCALLKGKDTCPIHHKTNEIALPAYPGEVSTMLSYLTAKVSPSVISKGPGPIWSVSMSQVTSRSISHVIDVDRVVAWDQAPADAKNMIINGCYEQMWGVLRQPDSKSPQLKAVATNAAARADKLFLQLLVELSTKYGDARWVHGRTEDKAITFFENPHTFLAGLTGANSQYSSYSSHTPGQLALLHELALREGRKTNPSLVAEIMGCYQKVREAEKYETTPYVWDQETVKKVMLRGLFKPDPTEVQLPF